jgi:hypothetical protein
VSHSAYERFVRPRSTPRLLDSGIQLRSPRLFDLNALLLVLDRVAVDQADAERYGPSLDADQAWRSCTPDEGDA